MSERLRVPAALTKLVVFSLFSGFAAVIAAAQPPREVEDPKGKVIKKIVVDDDDSRGRKRGPGDDDAANDPNSKPPDVRLEELSRAASEIRNPALKEALTKYVVPFDRITEGSAPTRVRPIPLRKTEWAGHEAIEVTPLDRDNKPQDKRGARVAEIKNVEHFEQIVQAEADRIQKQKIEGATNADQLWTAERLLAAGLHFHEYSRTSRVVDGAPRNLRRGKGWDEVRDPLAAKLKGVQLDLLKVLADANDAARLRDLVSRLMLAYPKDAEMAKAVAAVQAGEAERLLKQGTDQDAIAARKLIDDLESVYPGAGGDAVKAVRKQLRDLAVKALNRSQEKNSVGDERTARDELMRAIALDPELDGIREMQKKLKLDYQVLYVGARQFPQNLSPATARLDSEKQAVELIFEGLLQEIPDESGAAQYRPAAASAMPVSIPGARDFSLRVMEFDSSKRPCFDSADVVGTVNMLRTRPDTWAAYPLAWLSSEPPLPKDTGNVRISLGAPHPDPRAVLTFKMQPTRWMTQNGKSIDDGLFAESPFGTGPFRLQSSRTGGGSGPREMVFVNNPLYGQRDRAGLPTIREIHFVEVSKIDPKQAFQEGKLHILPDIKTAEIDDYAGPKSTLRTKVEVVTSSFNRRVHILALNLRRPYLQSKSLRQGLSLMIDREDILRKEFRAGKPEFHRPMTGPFPPGSWASTRGGVVPPPIMNQDLAMARLKAYLAADQSARKDLDLAYAEEDPHAEKVCDEIRRQMDTLFRGEEKEKKIQVHLVKMPLVKLLEAVNDQHAFDMAYLPFDYPDDWYPFALGAALDPAAAGRGGRNCFGFLDRSTRPDEEDQALGRALNKIRTYRDFAEGIHPQAIEIAKMFNESVPFIPLWQLDRHMVVSRKLKVFITDSTQPVHPRLLNPTILFQGIERWRVE